MGLIEEPSPYYLLIILALALFKKYVLYPVEAMRPNTGPSRIYEAVLTVIFVLYSAYIIAYYYFGIKL